MILHKTGRKTGQSSLEYAILIIIVLGALLTVQNYAKRGMQGRWKESADQLGDQYDPRTAVTNIVHRTFSSTNTTIVALNTDGGYWTKRTDDAILRDQKTGHTSVGAY